MTRGQGNCLCCKTRIMMKAKGGYHMTGNNIDHKFVYRLGNPRYNIDIKLQTDEQEK